MKICLIGVFPENMGDVKGGVANVILYLAQSLSKRGNEVHIITTGMTDRTVLDWDNFTVHVIKPPSHIPRVLTNPTFVRKRIHEKIMHLDPDFCHFHGSASYA
ncbi:MAG: glycosyltransferase, partial [Chlorobium sp.]|nr:glycosyltransferase [Chlorobium sp.]